MKILHVNEHLALKGGVETYMLGLLPLLEAEGLQSHILYGKGEPDLWSRTSAEPSLGQVGFKAQKVAEQKIKARLSEIKPDVIHLHNVQNLGVLDACLDYGPTVMTSHDYRWVCPANTFFFKRTQEVCPRSGAGLGCFTTTLTKHCLTPRPLYASYFYYRSKKATRDSGRFSRIIAPSDGARRRLVGAGISKDKITVLPYFCPLEPSEKPRPLPDRPTITFIGRIAPNKGQEFFLEALGKLPAEVKGVMVGNISPSIETQLRDQARKLGCEDRLDLHPWATREEVLALMDRTSVFVFPSLWEETLGIVGIEALSRGVPVVASNIGGVSEWLLPGENGFMVPPKDSDAMALAIKDILSSRERTLEMGQNGIDYIRQKFLPGHHTRQLIDIYNQVLETSTISR